ncbi:MAG: MBL fold metallo-hydrolase [Patescibacteria group bacterium]|nr:MBL fold metallo-hydrolase [Patescibacteria group bacterium]
MFKEIIEKINFHKNSLIILLALFLILDFFVYSQIFISGSPGKNLEIYFFNVGQGDSEFVVLPGGVKVLIDGGPPNGRVLEELLKAMPSTERYIDLVLLSHPQLDHFGGLVDVVRRYKIGAFIWNGEQGEARAFEDLKNNLMESSVKIITLISGDAISYKNSRFNILSPTKKSLTGGNANEKTLVLSLLSNNSKTIFTGDIDAKIEKRIADMFDSPIDILKVAHHGSKFSSSANFLDILKPKLAVIGVGKNSYGHPTPEVLRRLGGVGARIFRTDRDGTLKLVINDERIKIFKNNR